MRKKRVPKKPKNATTEEATKDGSASGEEKKAPKEKTERTRRRLRVILAPDQVAERADRSAHLLAERDAKESMHKAAQKHAKSEIESIEAQIRELSTQVRDKACYMEVDIERRFDYAAGIVREYRMDTGELESERAMTLEERQLGLDLDKKKGDEGGGGAGDVDGDFEDEGGDEEDPEASGAGEEEPKDDDEEDKAAE